MPAKYLMEWLPTTTRWRIQYCGTRYVRSCRQLNAPPTKEGSYQAANAWWRAKMQEIEGEDKPHFLADLIGELKRRGDQATGDRESAKEWDGKVEEAERLTEADITDINPDGFLVSEKVRKKRDLVYRYRNNLHEPHVAVMLFGDAVPTTTIHARDETIRGYADAYLEGFNLRRKAGDLSDGEYALQSRCITIFVEWAGGTNQPASINAKQWEGYWKHLLGRTTDGKKFGPIYAAKCFKYARRFVRWLSDMGINPAPSNLSSKLYRFDTAAKKIPLFTPDEAKDLVKAAPGQLKLHLLLMLNCGFTQSDLSKLTHAEIDMDAGTITRQRGKTRRRHGDSVPTVRWELWRTTHDILKKYKSDHPTLALTTENGKPLVDRGYNDAKGKAITRDSVASNFRHIKKRLKIDKPLKVFRKTAASELDKHETFGRYAQFFLGQAPDGVAATHYVQPSQDQFDSAVAWLGTQFGY